ncbi:hypothetical protein L210DRAFT_3530205 [Boletus edulis BED1]|uniref:Zn(2)-C6 fungal-type domain-containing protein n=1 Tax=Boletus edulis BED1 TaxID=1328754 RepID=A0AAD4GHN8_BOLED|nr:hypothetical protein L210DRAFT_3530205 [Boletus edulis BED1]
MDYPCSRDNGRRVSGCLFSQGAKQTVGTGSYKYLPISTPSCPSQFPLVVSSMSTEPRAIRKERTSPDATSPNPAPEGDHRKRRRNRTTQSCLNCHTSKRMCDRKRPCGRCTQLGLTGLCVYEVDDPSQRSNAQDESSRLRQRVAELEGVIRELKNKPHPRWAKSGSSLSKETDKSHARTRSRSASAESIAGSRHQSDISRRPTNSNADPQETAAEKQTCLVDETLQPDYFPSAFSPSPTGSTPLSTLAFSPYFDTHSSPSAPSTGVVTPMEEHPQMQITVAGDQHLNNDIDLSSLFMSYPDLLACVEDPGHVERVLRATSHGQHVEPCSMKHHHPQLMDGHCGCLNEAANYNVVLELSLRLRKAADILSHSANHRFNNGCLLNQRITDLDLFATTVLGNITTSPNDFGAVHLRSRANTAPTYPVPPTFPARSCIPPIRAPAISPSSLRPWSGVPCVADPSTSCDESFMSWEQSCRV